MTRRNISNHRISTRTAREQQSWNRLQHAKWATPERDQPSWAFAVAIAALLIIMLGGQFG